MEFQDAKLKDILKAFSQQTGINVIARADIGDQPITLYFEDVDVLDAFDQILTAGNLTYERASGSDIYLVKPTSEVGPTTMTRVYRLKYARVSKSVLAQAATAFGARTPFEGGASIGSSASGSAGGAGGGGGGFGGAGGAAAAGTGVGIDVVLQSLLTEAGSIVVDGRTNSLILTDVPENFPRLEAAMAALDVRTRQIMVDAEVIETGLNKTKDLGIKWSNATEGDLFKVTLGERTSRFPWSWFGDEIAPTSATRFSATTLSAASAVAILQALETDTDSKVLARPKVLTLDNESAIIRLTTDESIGFTSTSQATTGSQTSTPERRLTGVVLVVTPQVNDGGYITMLVEPSVTKTVDSRISPPTNQATPRDPKTRGSRTIVRIRSGDTLVVGGLIDRTEEQSVRGVPVLKDLPFFGGAFKRTEVKNTASELLVFLTPQVLEEPGAAQLAAAAPAAPIGERAQELPEAQQRAMDHALHVLERSADPGGHFHSQETR
jgi:type II secretory pathway component GspD/PulD (secretin)